MASEYNKYEMPDFLSSIFSNGFGQSQSNSASGASSSYFDDDTDDESYDEIKMRLTTLQKQYNDLLEEFGLYKARIKSNAEAEKTRVKKDLIKGFLNDFVVFMVNTYNAKRTTEKEIDDTDYFILNKMNEYLSSMNVVPMENAVGKPFDYKTMDAVYSDRNSDKPSGTVSAVLYNGFMMDGEVLLPQKVAVVP